MSTLVDRLREAIEAEETRLRELDDPQTIPAAIYWRKDQHTQNSDNDLLLVEVNGVKRFRRVWLNTDLAPDWTWNCPDDAFRLWSAADNEARLRDVAGKREILELHELEPEWGNDELEPDRRGYGCRVCDMHQLDGQMFPYYANSACRTVLALAKGYGIEVE